MSIYKFAAILKILMIFFIVNIIIFNVFQYDKIEVYQLEHKLKLAGNEDLSAFGQFPDDNSSQSEEKKLEENNPQEEQITNQHNDLIEENRRLKEQLEKSEQSKQELSSKLLQKELEHNQLLEKKLTENNQTKNKTDKSVSKTALFTSQNTNIRQCGDITCNILGIVPEFQPVYPVLDKDRKLVKNNKWILVEYKGVFCFPENSHDGNCSEWKQTNGIQAYLSSNLLVNNLALLNIPLKVDPYDANIRECASVKCKSLGVIKKHSESKVHNLERVMQKNKPIVEDKWVLVRYSGDFCYPQDFDNNVGVCNKWGTSQSVSGYISSNLLRAKK